MAFDQALAARIRRLTASRWAFVEKKMFGGIGFLLNGNLCVGVWKDSLVARVGPAEYETALSERHVRPFDITGRPMSGWVLVGPDGVADDERLDAWVGRAAAFIHTLAAK
jgi:hypothetical protein